VRSTSSEAASRSALAVLEVCSSGGTSGGTLLRLAPNGRYVICAKCPKFLGPPALPPLLTETHRYDRSGRKTSMKSTPASPCQRGGRRFEPGLVLQKMQAPSAS
jgi:hypothetical protein